MFVLFLIAYLVGINLLTFYLYWYDKRGQDNRSTRVSEQMLLLAGFFGGTPAAWVAQHTLQHKLKKSKFQNRFHMLTVIQVGLIVFLPAPILYAL